MVKRFVLLLLLLTLTACQKPSHISVDGAPLHAPDKTAYLQEGSLHFRGLDGKHLDLRDTPNPYASVLYVLRSGEHEIFAMNIQGGHIVMPENLRCYKIKANFEAGVEYVMAEDKDAQLAYIKRKDTDQKVAIAKPFDDQTAYSGGCVWHHPKK